MSQTPSQDTSEERPARPTFERGELVAGRYRIVRFVAPGGMAEVYEAEDVDLGDRVALKTIRPELSRDPSIVERFKREIQLARRVTHPDVCRIYELGQHSRGDGRAPVLFLTMQLLHGTTLAERLYRDGRMSEAEALPLLRQMGAGLAAAHRAGVIHRDFKTSNVMLVSGTSGEREAASGEQQADPRLAARGSRLAASAQRAVVMDFGLARAILDEDTAKSLTESGILVGTPESMAPEQLSGEDVGAPADIYALGVAAYEVLTGKKAFPSRSRLSAITQLDEMPVPPRQHVPELDERWEAWILRCLQPNPARRFGSVDEALKALDGVELASGPKAVRRSMGRPRVRRLAGAVLAMLVAAGAAALWLQAGRAPDDVPAASGAGAAAEEARVPRRTVAVLGFKSLASRPAAAWLSTALSEMLTTELGAGGRLRLLPGESVARMKLELRLEEAETLGADTLRRIRRHLGADLVVLGSYLALDEADGAQIRLDLRVQETSSGEVVASLGRMTSEAELFDLVAQAGAELRERLGGAVLAPAEIGSVRAAHPRNPLAARLYAEGLERLRLFDAFGAREYLERAVSVDGRFSQGHSALAQAWSALGYDELARHEAQRAFELAAGLGREERLWAEGRFREMSREWERAIEIYGTLFEFFPDNLEYGLRLASAQASAGQAEAALGTLAALRSRPLGLADLARLDLSEALAAEALADHRREQAAAARAAAQGRSLGAHLLVARARLAEGWALANLGRLAEAIPAFEEARGLLAAAGDRGGAAHAQNRIALIRSRQGDLQAATQGFDEALATFRQLQDRRGEGHALNNIANVRLEQGRLAEARELYEQALALKREIGDRQGTSTGLVNLALVQLRQAELAAARSSAHEALEIGRQTGDRQRTAIALYTLGDVLRAAGELGGARAAYDESVQLCHALGDRRNQTFGLFGRGEAAREAGDLVGARQWHEAVLVIRGELKEKGTGAESRLALAALDLAAGRPAQAEAAARAAAGELRALGVPELETRACTLWLRALLAAGRPDEAKPVADRLAELMQRLQNPSILLQATIAMARLEGAGGTALAAVGRLDAAAREAERLGLVAEALSARLAAAELELAAGRAKTAHARLAALRSDAEARGFGRIARQAAAALETASP
jgi:eukaryotic-like serine/threonine-protein kinase